MSHIRIYIYILIIYFTTFLVNNSDSDFQDSLFTRVLFFLFASFFLLRYTDFMQYFSCYLILMNLFSFGLCATDKYFAVHKRRRIRERTLFLSAIAGGSTGLLLGMYLCRHKTKHRSFTIGVPCILLLQLLFLGICHYYIK